MRILKSRWTIGLMIAVFYLTLLPFVVHGIGMVGIGLSSTAVEQSYLFAEDHSTGNAAMLLHIVTGTVLLVLVPLQLLKGLRRKFNGFHRALGAVLIALAVITGLSGMVYIPLRGTIGGPVMSVAFFLYGLCLFVSALMLARMAWTGDLQGHWIWGLRLFWLALGSWLYRLHYTLWYLLTGGLGSEPNFSGSFDLIQNFAFYIPYLLAVQVWVSKRRSSHQGALVTDP